MLHTSLVIDSDRIPEQNENQYASPCITRLFFDHKHSIYKDECSKRLEERIQINANHSVYKDADYATGYSSIVDILAASRISVVDLLGDDHIIKAFKEAPHKCS